MTAAAASHCVYTIAADRVVLYVGCTNNPPRRLTEHRHHWLRAFPTAHVSVKGPFPRSAAFELEAQLIRQLNPLRNSADLAPGSETVGLAFRVTPDCKAWLVAAARREGTSASAIVRKVVREARQHQLEEVSA